MERGVGLRERKKQQTKATLVQAAVRLFEQQGYDNTTIAEITAAADVSTRTFFSYFESKEDVVFGGDERHLARLTEVIAERAATADLVDALVAGITEVLRDSASERAERFVLAPAVLRLVQQVPALQAAAMRRMLFLQRSVADALHAAYPGADPVDTGVVVGSLFGGLHAAMIASVRGGGDAAAAQAAAQRAIRVVVHGLRGVTGT